MEGSIEHTCKPVEREDAEQYLVITLLSFAASMILVHLFLEFTGYPQVGNSETELVYILVGTRVSHRRKPLG